MLWAPCERICVTQQFEGCWSGTISHTCQGGSGQRVFLLPPSGHRNVPWRRGVRRQRRRSKQRAMFLLCPRAMSASSREEDENNSCLCERCTESNLDKLQLSNDVHPLMKCSCCLEVSARFWAAQIGWHFSTAPANRREPFAIWEVG